MLAELAGLLLLTAIYCAPVVITVLIIFKIPCAYKACMRLMDFIDRVNDKIDEAFGYYDG